MSWRFLFFGKWDKRFCYFTIKTLKKKVITFTSNHLLIIFLNIVI